MKHFVITDTHMDRKNGSISEIQITSDFFYWCIEKAKERDIRSLIHLGDWFHGRRSVSVPALEKSTEIFNSLSTQFTDGVFILKGNHDIYYKNVISPSSLDFLKLKNQKNIKIIEYPEVINEKILLIPWIIRKEDITKIVGNYYNVKYAMGHLPINEITMNRSNAISKDEILNISDLQKYERVLSGHFHMYGQYKNITYIGSPYHMDFNDTGDRGICIFDDVTGDIEFIDYTEAPKYIIFNAEKINYDLVQGNNIRIDFYNNLGINEINDIINSVENLSPNSLNVSYKFSPSFTVDEDCDNISELSDNREILIDYLGNSDKPKNVKMSLLTKIIDSFGE